MRFSAAMKFCIYGKEKIYRTEWNGKDQYVALGENISFLEGDKAYKCNKSLIFHGISGIQVGWLASQDDMLANDWEVL